MSSSSKQIAYDAVRYLFSAAVFASMARLRYQRTVAAYVALGAEAVVLGGGGHLSQRAGSEKLATLSWSIIGGAFCGVGGMELLFGIKRLYNGFEVWNFWQGVGGVRQGGFAVGVVLWMGNNSFQPYEEIALVQDIQSFRSELGDLKIRPEHVRRYRELEERLLRYERLHYGDTNPLVYITDEWGALVAELSGQHDFELGRTLAEQIRRGHQELYPWPDALLEADQWMGGVDLAQTKVQEQGWAKQASWLIACGVNALFVGLAFTWYPKTSALFAIGGVLAYSMGRHASFQLGGEQYALTGDDAFFSYGTQQFSEGDIFAKGRWLAFRAALVPLFYTFSWASVPVVAFLVGMHIRFWEEGGVFQPPHRI